MQATDVKRSPLVERLAALRARTRAQLAVDGLASLSLFVVASCLLSFGLDRIFRLPREQRAIILAIGVAFLGSLVWRRVVARIRAPMPLDELARAVEKKNPKLEWRLVSAVQFLGGADPRGSKELADLVVAQAESAAREIRFEDVLDTASVGKRLLNGGMVLVAGLFLVGGFPEASRTWFARNVLLSATAEWPKDTRLHVSARVGSVVTELGAGKSKVAMPRGADLAVLVSASGVVPTRARLAFEFSSSHLSGGRDLAYVNGRFRHVFEKVGEDLEFVVRGGDDEAGPFQVQVVRPPWIEGLTIESEPPAYTNVARKTFGLEAGEVALPAGTTVTIAARCTKKVKQGWIEVRYAGARLDAPPIRSEARVEDERVVRASLVLDRTAACTLDVLDADDLNLERPVALTLRSIPDAAPKVQLAVQGIGQLITPEATIPLECKATDDYGLQAGALRFKSTLPNQKPKEGVLDVTGVEGKRAVELPLTWDVASLGLVPGTFLNFYAEVRDADPKGSKPAQSNIFALRVVNPEELLMDLIRRQHELRRELERVREDEEKLAQGLENLDAKVQERAPKTQRAVHKAVADATRALQQVVDEMRNNKLLDERQRNRIDEDVVKPLAELRDGELVRARDLADATAAAKDADRMAKSREAGSAARNVVNELDAIIAHMKRVADLAELVAKLREFLKKQRDLMEETRRNAPR